MKEIIEIIMRRDSMNKADAKEHCKQAMEMVYAAIDEGSLQEAEDVFSSELGLEPDYLINLLV